MKLFNSRTGKKLGSVAMAAAIAGTGLTAAYVAEPGQQVEAASIGGVSANTSKANWTNNDIIHVSIINHNSYEVKLVTQLQHLNGSTWENRRSAETSWWTEYQSAGLSIMPIVTDGTYRYQVKVYHGVTGALMGTMYTSNFYVK